MVLMIRLGTVPHRSPFPGFSVLHMHHTSNELHTHPYCAGHHPMLQHMSLTRVHKMSLCLVIGLPRALTAFGIEGKQIAEVEQQLQDTSMRYEGLTGLSGLGEQ